ncbi:MAG: hypothetical protein K0U16_07460 [Gammaproteobacteria bacterium]|nr:hypothetical protein [Gammaproteobacteria bacterium]
MSIVASTSERVKVASELHKRVYRSAIDREWYWQMKNKKNHEIEGASCQGYKNKEDCVFNLLRVTGFEPDVIVDEGASDA